MSEQSFSLNLKTELSKIKPTGCCRIAECYGLMLFSRSFCKSDISMRTKSRDAAEKYAELIKLCFDANVLISENENGTSFTATVTLEGDREKIISFYDSGEADWIMNPKFMKRNCCRWAFLRGAFLACGSMNNPEKSYHLEFAVKDPTLAFAYSAFLELFGHKPKYTARKNVTAVYYGNNNSIEDLLGGMGASVYTLELIETTVVKDMRNALNRKNNFETANISKTVSAAVKQNEAINYIVENNLLSMLPDELYVVAVARKDNPDASLSALCQIVGGNISRSGINHRLQRIILAAEDFKTKFK